MSSSLRRVEDSIGGFVERVFGRLFRGHVEPVELARKLAREMEDHKTVSVSRVYVPNEYVVYLSASDRARFASFEGALTTELGVYVAERARHEGFTLLSTPAVRLETDTDLRVGEYGIACRVVDPPAADGEAPVAEPAAAVAVPPAPVAPVAPIENGREPEPAHDGGDESDEPAPPDGDATAVDAPDAELPAVGAVAGAGAVVAGAATLAAARADDAGADDDGPSADEVAPGPAADAVPAPPATDAAAADADVPPAPEPQDDAAPALEPAPPAAGDVPDTPDVPEVPPIPAAPVAAVATPLPPPGGYEPLAGVSGTQIISAAEAQAEGLARETVSLLVGNRRHRLTQRTTTLGRSRDCDIVVEDANASRRHAEIRHIGLDYFVVDLGSTNGTLVNGQRVRRHPLAHGDVLMIGTTELRVEATG